MPIPSYVIPDAGLAAARPAAGSPGRLYYSTDTDKLERDNGSGWDLYASAAGGGLVLLESYCCVVDQKAQNTNGGNFALGAWRTRDINTEQADPDGIVALAGNQITLDAGTYLCSISCPAYDAERHATRLYNVTGGVLLVAGSSEYTLSTQEGQTRSFIVGRFTVAGAQALEIQHQCQNTSALGFGVASNFAVEIYTIAEFLKEA